jgi:tetratricopeptide (TPR) repeat protein
MNRRATHIVTVAFAFSFTLALAGGSQAAEHGKRSAEAYYQKGMKAYTLGHFEDAIEEFEKAYELRQEPIFLYNIAQSHRQNNSPQRAIFFYRRYLEADPEAKNRVEVEKRIKDMESHLNAKPENGAPPPPATPPTAPAPTTAAPPPVAPPFAGQPAPQPIYPVAPIQTQAAPDASAGRGLRIAGLTVGVVGVAGVVTGIFLGLHANSLYDDSLKGTYDDSKYQSSKSFRTLEWVSLGVGGAAVVAGGILYYLGHSAKPSRAPVALLPIAAPGTAGAVLFARF